MNEIPIDPPILVNKEYRALNGHARLTALKDIYPDSTLLMQPINFGDHYEVYALLPVTKSAEGWMNTQSRNQREGRYIGKADGHHLRANGWNMNPCSDVAAVCAANRKARRNISFLKYIHKYAIFAWG